MNRDTAHEISYLLPLKAATPVSDSEFSDYLRWLASHVGETIVIDDSASGVFDAHRQSWGTVVRHIQPEPDLTTPMGKVGNVLTGLRVARFETIIIADDDVRYDERSLSQVATALRDADVVRPQNYFDPLPWHARWDTGRMLLNRMSGGDWPGTVGVRGAFLRATSGYDGRAMFENLELVRTVVAAGGTERALLDAYVLRRPSTTSHFLSQRVRQAYDEFARPVRLMIQLAVLPIVLVLALTGYWKMLVAATTVVILIAELGRQRAGGTRYFPFSASLLAPCWLAERAICSWLAVFSRVLVGGVRYRGVVLNHAATPLRELRRRYRSVKTSVTPADRTTRYRSA